MSQGASASLSTKKLSGLLYSMGHTFDNLSSTRLATEEFLRTGNPEVLGSKQDLDLLKDLQDASSFALHYDYATQPFDVSYLSGINAQLKRTAAIEPGTLRTSANIGVHTREGFYVPPEPDAAVLNSYFTEALDHTRETDMLLSASTLFAQLAKAQPFGDGNKRSALLAANGLLVRTGAARTSDLILSVPTEEPDTDTFNERLSAWYLHNDSAVFAWLADWNERAATTI